MTVSKIVQDCKQYGLKEEAEYWKATAALNRSRVHSVASQVSHILNSRVQIVGNNKTVKRSILVLGFAYKYGAADVRGSLVPSIIERIIEFSNQTETVLENVDIFDEVCDAVDIENAFSDHVHRKVSIRVLNHPAKTDVHSSIVLLMHHLAQIFELPQSKDAAYQAEREAIHMIAKSEIITKRHNQLWQCFQEDEEFKKSLLGIWAVRRTCPNKHQEITYDESLGDCHLCEQIAQWIGLAGKESQLLKLEELSIADPKVIFDCAGTFYGEYGSEKKQELEQLGFKIRHLE